MSIQQNSVVSIHYTLKNDAGTVLDSSAGGEPLSYLHGHGNLIPGLERELTGRAAGDRLSVKIAPRDGYGERNDQLIQTVRRSDMSGVPDVREGMRLQAQTESGQVHSVVVTHVTDDTVTIDGNHPLAGETLHFDVEITQVRDASEEELSHGHVHGPGGHHHG